LPETPLLAFARVHKRAFGVALGSAAAMLLVVATLIGLVRGESFTFPLDLLSQFFPGYAVSPVGLLVGGAWAFAAGCAAGWLVALVRNVAVATILFVIRTRAELANTRDFLDHI
jgi:hypothetical protein